MKHARSMSGRLRQRIAGSLLVLGVAVGALAATPTPAQAATSIIACFQRPSLDPGEYIVRMDLRVWNPSTQAWQQTGQYLFAKISSKGPACQVLFVPPAYQNFYTTMMVDYRYTQNGTTVAWYGWSGEWGLPGTAGYIHQITAITKFNVLSSADGVGVHSGYWH